MRSLAAALAAAGLAIGGCGLWMPGSSYTGPLPPATEAQSVLAASLRRDVEALAASIRDEPLYLETLARFDLALEGGEAARRRDAEGLRRTRERLLDAVERVRGAGLTTRAEVELLLGDPLLERDALALDRWVEDLVRRRGEARAGFEEGVLFLRSAADHQAARSAHVEARLTAMGYAVGRQVYRAGDREFANLEVQIPGAIGPEEVVVVGAHLDAVDGSRGADDDGSGLAALLALAEAFREARPRRTLRFVFFANEEPPWFQRESMGSLVYARACRARREPILAMLSLESLGYYDDAPGSQRYPPVVGLLFPDRGDFVAFAGDGDSSWLVRRAIGVFRERAAFPSEGAALPAWIPGIGWSDHWSFWQADYAAIQITDTAPYRNPHYHTRGDAPDTLDYDRLARVVEGIEAVVRDLAGVE